MNMKLIRGWIDNRWLSLGAVVAVGALLRFMLLADVPSGYFHDEAWSALRAYELVSGAAPPQVYFAENNGMDALHVYLIALLFRVTGPLAIGSRIISSLAGSLTILATYWAAWELLAQVHQRHRHSLAAAFVVATLFWALTTSRSGWHVASMTLVVTASLAALFRARCLGRRRWYVVAGLLAGLAQYTYPTARFLPVLIALIGALDLVWRRGFARHTDTEGDRGTAHRRSFMPDDLQPLGRDILLNYGGVFVAAAIVFAPLGVTFAGNPEGFFVRAQQTMDAPLGENILKTLAGFSIYGDTEGLHNLYGRPALDLILSVFFVVGLIACIIQRRPAHLNLIAWLVVFSLPVAFTGQAPLFRRWSGVLPAEAMLIALGAGSVIRLARDSLRPIGAAAVAAALVVSAGWSIADYFGPYAHHPQMFWEYDSGITQVARYIRDRPDATVFLTPYDRFHEVVALTLAEAHRAPIQSYNGVACAVFPETTERDTEWVVVTEKDQHTLPLMQHIFPAGQIVWQIDSPAGSYARALRVPARQTAQLELTRRQQANLGGKVRLIGFDLPARAAPGSRLPVTLALKGIAPLEQPYKIFVHLRDEHGAVIVQADRLPCDFSLNEADWRPGDIVLETYAVEVPAETPPGTYRLVMGVYQLDSGARLPVLESDLPYEPDGVELGTVDIQP